MSKGVKGDFNIKPMEKIKELVNRHQFGYKLEYKDDTRLCFYILDSKQSRLLYIVCNVFSDDECMFEDEIECKNTGNTLFLHYFYLTFDYILYPIETELFYLLITMFRKDVQTIQL